MRHTPMFDFMPDLPFLLTMAAVAVAGLFSFMAIIIMAIEVKREGY